jgi:hypothetical protein
VGEAGRQCERGSGGGRLDPETGGPAVRRGCVTGEQLWRRRRVDGLAGLIHGFFFFLFFILLTKTGRATTSVNAMINHDLLTEAVAKTALVKAF